VPEISRFFGIVIAMFHNDHPPPHVHVRYGEYWAKFDIETGSLIAGKMPRRATALVQEWCSLHLEELRADWRLVQERRPPNKIEPLE
jgi:hypothetical protein